VPSDSGERWSRARSQWPDPKKAAGMRKLFKPSVPDFLAAADLADHRAARSRRSSRRDSPPR
jgi:hypothetical protein